jgi:hypothetical protein
MELSLNFRFGDVDLRGAAVDYHADPAAVRFTKRRDAKKLTKRVAHGGERLSEIASNCRAFL